MAEAAEQQGSSIADSNSSPIDNGMAHFLDKPETFGIAGPAADGVERLARAAGLATARAEAASVPPAAAAGTEELPEAPPPSMIPLDEILLRFGGLETASSTFSAFTGAAFGSVFTGAAFGSVFTGAAFGSVLTGAVFGSAFTATFSEVCPAAAGLLHARIVPKPSDFKAASRFVFRSSGVAIWPVAYISQIGIMNFIAATIAG